MLPADSSIGNLSGDKSSAASFQVGKCTLATLRSIGVVLHSLWRNDIGCPPSLLFSGHLPLPFLHRYRRLRTPISILLPLPC